MKYFHIRYECNDVRDDYAAAYRKEIPTKDMPSSINANL